MFELIGVAGCWKACGVGVWEDDYTSVICLMLIFKMREFRFSNSRYAKFMRNFLLIPPTKKLQIFHQSFVFNIYSFFACPAQKNE